MKKYVWKIVFGVLIVSLLSLAIWGENLGILPLAPTPTPTAEVVDATTITLDQFLIFESGDCITLKVNPDSWGSAYAKLICNGNRAELETALSQNLGRVIKFYKDGCGELVRITVVLPIGEETIWTP